MNKRVLILVITLSFIGLLFGMEKMDDTKIEKMRKIKKGTTYTEIVSEFGDPDEEIGSGLLIVNYVFPNSKIELHFFTGETLHGLREIKNTGEVIVYIPLEFSE